MKLLSIKKYPDRILREKCSLVERITEKEAELFEEMLVTMRYFNGIGLSAPQVGISKSFIVADAGDGAVRLANPRILKIKRLVKWEEGCLSVPGVRVAINRPDEIIVCGLNEEGRSVELKVRGLLARVLQHEIDHLNGRLIIDYLGFAGRMKFKLLEGRHKVADKGSF
ncbi:MAG: peptide deformylase [Candidatus Omnitrophica bacterium]|nr:peptide deformylase [Candidatus Omnitrophota bacterium]